jgi:hypothetical protein
MRHAPVTKRGSKRARHGVPCANVGLEVIQVHKGRAIYAALFRCQGLNEPGAFHGVVTIDELDAEPLGFGVDHQRVACGEADESVPA